MILNVFLEDFVKHIYVLICTGLHDKIFNWIFLVNFEKIFPLNVHNLKIKNIKNPVLLQKVKGLFNKYLKILQS